MKKGIKIFMCIFIIVYIVLSICDIVLLHHKINYMKQENTQISTFESSKSQNNTISKQKYISKSEAEEIAFKHANIDKSQIAFLYIHREIEDGLMVYEIDFYIDVTEYSYTINAISGDIIDYDVEYD